MFTFHPLPFGQKKSEECAPALDSCLECLDVQAFRIKPWKKSSPWLVSLREKATRDPVWPPFPSQNFFQLSKAALLLARPYGAGSVYSSSHWLSKSDSEKQRSVASNTVDGTFKPFRCQARHRSIQSLRMAGSSCSTMVLTRCLSGFSGWKSKGKTSKRLLKGCHRVKSRFMLPIAQNFRIHGKWALEGGAVLFFCQSVIFF